MLKKVNGYTFLEIVVVVAILSILAGISMPAFFNLIKSARIDQAKSVLNSAIAECLQNYRIDPTNGANSVVTTQGLATLDQAGYQVATGKNTCGDFMLTPKDPNETYLFPIGFMVRGGKVTKLATPASDRSSEAACKSWGTCGVPPELQAQWDALAKIEADKKVCEDKFWTWLRLPSSGSSVRWDNTTNTCTSVVWAFEGTQQPDQAAYEAAIQRKYGEICVQKIAAEKTKSPPTTGGPIQITECGPREFYFCLGDDKGSLDAMNACIAANAEAKCIADRELVRLKGPNGKYGPVPGPGACGDVVWRCDDPVLGKVMVTTEAAYLQTTCGAVPPPPPSCGTPPTVQCDKIACYSNLNCKNLCSTYGKCKGFIP